MDEDRVHEVVVVSDQPVASEITPCRPTARWTDEIVPYLRWLCARTPDECALVALGMQEVDLWA